MLESALTAWATALGDSVDEQFHRVAREAIKSVGRWKPLKTRDQVEPQIVFGGGTAPLWRQLVAAWPEGEPVLQWSICSPFWPDAATSAASNPFEAIVAGLTERGVSLRDCELQIIARSDAPHANALPRFPFALVQHLRSRSFPISQGCILPARLDAGADETLDGMAGKTRELHAKWVLLTGPRTVVALVGSANFTRRGLGVTRDPKDANIEACVLLKWPRGRFDPTTWRPPILGRSIDWASCAAADLCDPIIEDEPRPDWPDFLNRVELTIHWPNLPEPDGALRLLLRGETVPPFTIALVSAESSPTHVPIALETASSVPILVPLSPDQVRVLLARRVIEIVWSAGERRALFPINIQDDSKAGMPSILAARPSEEQLLAYFHGRISEEDLLARLEQQAREAQRPSTLTADDSDRLRQLQSYVVREFVESLYGMARTIQESAYSPRAAEQALLGDLSPVGLAEQVLHAFLTHRRSATAAAFQLVELVRVVSELQWPVQDAENLTAFEEVRTRAITRLLSILEQAAQRQEFAKALGDREFAAFARMALPPAIFRRVAMIRSEQDLATAAPQASDE